MGSFEPGGGADPLPLTAAYGPLLEGEAPPGTKLELWYDNGSLQLGTWTTASWQLYRHEKLGHELLDWHRTKTTKLPVTGGEATLYAVYDKNFSRCPGKAPDVFAAAVEVDGVVLGMVLPTCYTCLAAGHTAPSWKPPSASSTRSRPGPDRESGRDTASSGFRRASLVPVRATKAL